MTSGTDAENGNDKRARMNVVSDEAEMNTKTHSRAAAVTAQTKP